MLLPCKLNTITAKLPTRGRNEDAGIDLYASEHKTIAAGSWQAIETDLAMAIPAGHVGIIKDRSSMGGKGIHVLGGVIDSNYRGTIKVMLMNFGPDYIISCGDKIAQMVIVPYAKVTPAETDHLTETDRGEQGFGSSGK